MAAEDNPAFADMIAYALEGTAEEIVMARDGVEALDYLLGRGDYAGRDVGMLPGLVLLDMFMPRLGGLETLRRLRADKRTKLLPVVMFSSSDDPQDKLDSYVLGANSFISKASDSMPFVELVRYVARYWLELNEPPDGM